MALTFPDIDPVALSLGPLQVRWYALAYLAGIIGGWKYAMWLGRQDEPLGRRPNAQDADNILPWIVLGIILGGRLGYVLFYNLPFYLEHPSHILHLWEGGMSFHGGLLGVAVACITYARYNKFPALAMGDMVATVVPIGLFFGRIANFINGELFGRVTTVSWAMVFPTGGDLPRHPSQLYEAFLEGLVLFVVLWWCARRPAIRRAPGMLFGIFTVGYAICRFAIEFVREPDIQIGFIAQYFTLGQLLCLPMMLAGVVMIAYARKHSTTAQA